VLFIARFELIMYDLATEPGIVWQVPCVYVYFMLILMVMVVAVVCRGGFGTDDGAG
jgi:hypothetical protein